MSSYLENININESIKEDDYIISFAKGLSLLEAFGVERQVVFQKVC